MIWNYNLQVRLQVIVTGNMATTRHKCCMCSGRYLRRVSACLIYTCCVIPVELVTTTLKLTIVNSHYWVSPPVNKVVEHLLLLYTIWM